MNTRFDVTFLGTGTSQGVPMIGCTCPVCVSTDLKDFRTRSSVYIQTDQVHLVIDTGPEFRIQCMREKVVRIDAVLYTHAHMDHVAGFDDLRRFCDLRRKESGNSAMPIYGSAHTLEAIQGTFSYAFDSRFRFPGYVQPEPHVIDGTFTLGDLIITPLPIPHGSLMVTGFLFEQNGKKPFAYLNDCHEVPEEVVKQLGEIDTVVLDALRRNPHPTHMNLQTAITTAQRIAPRQTFFTHLCHDLGHASTEAELPEGIHVAYDGMKLGLG